AQRAARQGPRIRGYLFRRKNGLGRVVCGAYARAAPGPSLAGRIPAVLPALWPAGYCALKTRVAIGHRWRCGRRDASTLGLEGIVLFRTVEDQRSLWACRPGRGTLTIAVSGTTLAIEHDAETRVVRRTYNTLRPHQALDERAAYLAVGHCG